MDYIMHQMLMKTSLTKKLSNHDSMHDKVETKMRYVALAFTMLDLVHASNDHGICVRLNS